jgi:hypothetical protein
MEEIAVYKAKEELLEHCSAYIDRKFESEKGLIKDYIGLGLKVAIAGVGIAVLTAGFFGWKSYDDVSKSVQAEIKARFNNDNPIVKYENLIKDAAIQGMIAALTTRIESGKLFSDKDELSFLTGALQDDGVNENRKFEILQFAAILPYDSDKLEFARASRNNLILRITEKQESH